MASSQTQVAGNEDSASKISQTQNEPIQDSDYTLSRVPAEAKQPFWRILVIRIGSRGFSEGNLSNGDHRFAVKRSHRVLEGFDGGDLTGVIEVNGNRCGLSVNCHCAR